METLAPGKLYSFAIQTNTSSKLSNKMLVWGKNGKRSVALREANVISSKARILQYIDPSEPFMLLREVSQEYSTMGGETYVLEVLVGPHLGWLEFNTKVVKLTRANDSDT